MRQLLLLRHAKSSHDEPGMPDHARPLNAQGQAAAASIGAAMRARGLAPDLVLVSTARRTMETLAGLEPWEETPLIDPLDALYLAPAERMLGLIREVGETVRSVLVIGHNPGMHDLAILLMAPGAAEAARLRASYPTGALAEFSLARPWRETAAGAGRLERFLTPRDLGAGPG